MHVMALPPRDTRVRCVRDRGGANTGQCAYATDAAPTRTFGFQSIA